MYFSEETVTQTVKNRLCLGNSPIVYTPLETDAKKDILQWQKTYTMIPHQSLFIFWGLKQIL